MKKGFTLAEVLITLAIIGVVAALTIPSVIINAREQGNITAFKKAVSVLNSAIALSVAVDSAGPGSAAAVGVEGNLIDQLAGKMNTITKGSSATGCTAGNYTDAKAYDNTEIANQTCWFTTADGMQFVLVSGNVPGMEAYCKTDSTKTTSADCPKDSNNQSGWVAAGTVSTDSCGSTADCVIMVDVNGTAKPNKASDLAKAGTNVSSSNITGHVTDRFFVQVNAENAKALSSYDKAVIAK